ncbi:GGDEF domain-containing protein [Shewanella sp. HL-SH8]|jgi:diguanylate cyclase (GGDEF)-like protein|uniref:diguanylate cyclase DgcS n=1 Tax=Shewanella TaxID=22 RepID=UPI001CF8F37C|nr:GGDEF domain-containing protein [Shewanella glacialimarina]UCX05143.1 GGDEF domain-containing protein [Shewanella glacialimarina]
MDFAIATELFPEEYGYRSNTYLRMEPELDLVQVIQQLHASLDPRTVFACYGKIVGQHLPIKALQLFTADQKFTWGRHNGIELVRHIKTESDTLKIHYYLSVPLSPIQMKLLNHIEALTLQPFSNALKYQQVSNQAMFDALTGLGNRYYFRKSMHKSIARAQRKQGHVSLIVLDLDKFKQLNDQFGHTVGDKVLTGFAALINDAIRDTDQAFRIGGDEFVVITEGGSPAASLVCQRIIDNLPLHPELMEYNVKCSLGIAQSRAKEDLTTLYERADKAMYSAKAAGRNCFRICADTQ